MNHGLPIHCILYLYSNIPALLLKRYFQVNK